MGFLLILNMRRFLLAVFFTPFFFSSCAAYLPEFQDLSILEKGETRTAIGAYGGGIGKSNIGLSAFYASGSNEDTDFNAQIAVGGRFEGDLFPIVVIAQAGPKFVNKKGTFALYVPVGFSYDPEETIILSTPTVYCRIGKKHPTKSHTLFYRQEIAEVPSYDGLMGYATFGYRYGWMVDGKHQSVNLNVSAANIFIGYGIDLLRTSRK